MNDEQYWKLVPEEIRNWVIRPRNHGQIESPTEYENSVLTMIGKIVALNEECQSIANFHLTANEQLRHKLSACEEKLAAAEEDAARLDWIIQMMLPNENYCEIFFAGMRGFGGTCPNHAVAFQIESNPQLFKTLNRPTLREAIDAARQSEQKEEG